MVDRVVLSKRARKDLASAPRHVVAWRAIYEVLSDGRIEFVSVKEVTHHAY